MATMKKSEMLAAVKENGLVDFLPLFESKNAERTGDYSYDFLVDIGDGQEHWLNITATAKDYMLDDNGKRVPYDPFVKQAEWMDKCAERKANAEERERKHAETVRKAEEKKAAAAAKRAAKKSAAE